jgi:type IV pilus assembly protein PilM
MELPQFFGIDIGKNTTKVAMITRESEKKVKLSKIFSFQTGQGSLASEDVTLRSDLGVRIRDAINGAKLPTRKCVVALPEPAVFNRLLTFPDLEEAKLQEAIHWNAKQFIPIPMEDVQMDWIKTGDLTVNGKKMVQLLLVAAPKKLINQTVSIFKEANVELIAIETEAVATARVISQNYPSEPSLLVLDVGSSGTDLSVVANGHLIFSQSLGTGSDAMTAAISAAFSLDAVQAEQYKIKFGLLQDQAEGKIFKTLEPVVNIIVAEVTKTINFFKSKYQQSTPQKIMILGEGGKIPGLAAYLSTKLGIATELANLTQNIEVDKAIEADVQAAGLSGYAVAIGLALKMQ